MNLLEQEIDSVLRTALKEFCLKPSREEVFATALRIKSAFLEYRVTVSGFRRTAKHPTDSHRILILWQVWLDDMVSRYIGIPDLFSRGFSDADRETIWNALPVDLSNLEIRRMEVCQA